MEIYLIITARKLEDRRKAWEVTVYRFCDMEWLIYDLHLLLCGLFESILFHYCSKSFIRRLCDGHKSLDGRKGAVVVGNAVFIA